MSTTTSTLNSVLSALGGSNGIDVTSAVDSILYADRAPERGWQTQQATLNAQTNALNQLNTDSSTLADQLSALQDASGVLSSVVATSSDSSVVSATAANGTSSGNHTVVVNSLATTASWYSDEVAQQLDPHLRQLQHHGGRNDDDHHTRERRQHAGRAGRDDQ